MTAHEQQLSPLSQAPQITWDAASLLGSAFEAISDAMVLADAAGEIIHANAAFRALMGQTLRQRDTLVGLPLDAMLEPANRPQLRPLFEQVRATGEPVIIEEYAAHLPGDSEPRWYTWSLSPLFDERRHVVALLGSASEITELVRTREAQRQEAARLATLLNVLPAGVALYDAAGHLINQNAAAERITGQQLRPGEPSRSRHARYGMRRLDGTRLSESETPSGRARRGETFSDLACLIRGPEGHDIELLTSGAPLRDEQGNIIGAVVIFQDVTERRALERRTHTSLNALLRMAQATVDAPDDLHAVARDLAAVTCEVLACRRVGIMAIDAETQIVRPLAVMGLSPEEERQWWKIQPQDARYGEGGDPELAARFAAGEPLVLDMTQPPFNEQPNPFDITTALFVPMRLEGQLVGFISLDHAGERHEYTPQEIALAQGVADLAALIVERQRLQAAAAAAQAKALAFAETNARMHTFLGIAGHELRTPVTSIKSSVQLAARVVRQAQEAALPDGLRERMERAISLLEGANRQSDKLNRFISDLLDVTRIQAGTLEIHPTTLDLAEIVRQNVAVVHPAWPQRAITLDLPEAPLRVWGDPDRLGQVVTNLLTNALKYSPEGAPVAVRLMRWDRSARLEVIDHGPGLTPEQQARLFQAFSRVEGIERQSGAGVGLGLGLYICKTIIDRHNGTIGVSSQPGQGSTFWFVLPPSAGERMSESTLHSTGLPDLDVVLGGGFLRGALAVVLGVPGSGKTTLAGQMAFAAAREGKKVLILTALSEPTSKLVTHLRSFTFFDDSLLVGRVQVLSLQQALPNGLKATGDEILGMVRHYGAQVVVLDGFQGMREYEAEASQQAGRQFLYRLGTTLNALNIMTVVTSEADPHDPALFPEMTTADAILGMHFRTRETRHQRGFEVIKTRGAAQLDGIHALAIDHNGVRIIPRLEALVTAGLPGGNELHAGIHATQVPPVPPQAPSRERVPFGVAGLDELMQGGVQRGTDALMAGPSISGKTLLALAFTSAGISAGERVIYVNMGTLRGDLAFLLEPFALGRVITSAWQPGGPLTLIDSAAINIDPDAVAQTVLAQLDAHRAQRLVIDGIEALEEALVRDGDPHRHAAYFTAWRVALRRRGVTTLFVREVRDGAPSWEGPSRSMPDAVLRVRRSPTSAIVIETQRFGQISTQGYPLEISAPDGPIIRKDAPPDEH